MLYPQFNSHVLWFYNLGRSSDPPAGSSPDEPSVFEDEELSTPPLFEEDWLVAGESKILLSVFVPSAAILSASFLAASSNAGFIIADPATAPAAKPPAAPSVTVFAAAAVFSDPD
jgi:hypothetical protein